MVYRLAHSTAFFELVRAARAGDEASTAALLEQCRPRLQRFCHYLAGSTGAGNDVCQNTLLRALDELPKLRDTALFWSWLYRIARTQLIPVACARKCFSPLVTSSGTWARPVLTAIEREECALFMLTHIEEFLPVDVARIVGVPVAAVRSRLHRSRRPVFEV
jgi:DNA-directed RNA polymerase specialized sigma24 family protein